MSQEAFDGFLTGRAILAEASASGELTETRAAELETAIASAVLAWEKCIAATVVHYINDTVADIDAFDGANFADISAYKDYAKHWSEMKGFALGLQFNPRSPFREGDQISSLQDVLTKMGDAPVLADGTQLGVAYTGGVAAYRAALLETRDTLQTVYGFDAENAANW